MRVRPLFLALGLLGAACARPGEDRRSLLLVTLDTTRHDALSCAGGPAGTTPHLDRLAAEGVFFERAYTAVPITLPAHCSLLTGLYPLRHGVRDNGAGALPGSAVTLAEYAREADYQTAAFVGARVLDPSFGIEQGFERFDAPRGGTANGQHDAERPAREVVDGALAWLESRDRDRPFFLWVHVYDPHSPYEAPGANAREKYAGEVANADRELGRLFEALRAEGALERTLVVAAGDHGEGFGEHGEEGHSVHCYETTLRIPLIVRAPGWARFPAGARSDELVGIVDLLPTLCEGLGLAPPEGIDGRSVWSAPSGADHGLYFESYYGFLSFGWSPLTGWLDAQGKYVHATAPHFFDVATDPGEERDLLAEKKEAVRTAQRAMSALAELPVLEQESGAAVDEETLQDLRGLGYVGMSAASAAFPHPLAETGLPPPAEMIALYARSLEGLELAKSGRLAEAEAVFLEVLEQNPQNYFVLDHLATCQVQSGRVAEAATTLRRLVEHSPGAPSGLWYKLGVCLHATGKLDEAIDALKRANALEPKKREVLTELVQALRAAGRAEESSVFQEELEELGPP